METTPPVEKKKNSKILIIVGVLLLLCCCVITISAISYNLVFGYSGIASEGLKSDVLKALAENEASQNGCSDVKLIKGQMFLSKEQSGDGSWMETWQLMVCGESRLYSISFTPSSSGTDFFIKRLDQ